MKYLIFLLLVLPFTLQAQYKITTKKILIWTSFSVAGSMYGAREAYYANPLCFEQRWGVDKYSFFGSRQWERNYVGNRYHPKAIHKDELFGNFGRDFWHTSGYVSGGLVIGGTFIIGDSKQKLKHKVFDMLIGSLCAIGASSLTFNYLNLK